MASKGPCLLEVLPSVCSFLDAVNPEKLHAINFAFETQFFLLKSKSSLLKKIFFLIIFT